MTSPWLYLAIVVLTVLDAFLPLVPSEAAVLLAGTFAATQGPNLALVIAAGATGAVLGDHIAYAAGRGVGGRLLTRARPGSRTARAYAWARHATERRGGPVLVAARFLPGGRTATTITMGATRFPLRRFSGFDVVACVTWAVYCSATGYVGGRLFAEHPVAAVGVGMTVALTVAAVVELVQRRRRRGAARPAPSAAP
jgi:membrane protein DedA with SNARE-associated domain